MKRVSLLLFAGHRHRAGGTTAGGITVAIGGSNVSTATAVDFGSSPATSFTVGAGNVIVAVAPAGSSGAVTATVINGHGTRVGNPPDDRDTHRALSASR